MDKSQRVTAIRGVIQTLAELKGESLPAQRLDELSGQFDDVLAAISTLDDIDVSSVEPAVGFVPE